VSNKRNRIVLISPFTGGNAGDAAILRATIESLRSLNAEAEFIGATIFPDEFLRTHGVSGVTLISYACPYYTASGGAAQPIECENVSAMSLPKKVLFDFSPTLYRQIRGGYGVARALIRELHHWLIVWRVVRASSVVIVAGGGQIDEEWGGPWGHPFALFKWTLIARLVRVPALFLSVGVCHLDGRLARWFVARALAIADYVSIRDPWSLEFARSILGCRDAKLTPDLAFGLAIPPPRHALEPNRDHFTIGVSPIAFAHPDVWPKPNKRAYAAYCSVMAEFIRCQLLAGHKIVLFVTDGIDERAAQDVLEILHLEVPSELSDRVSFYLGSGLGPILERVRQLDAVIASRLHGVIISQMLGVPTVALAYDRKVTTHMSQIGQSDLCIEIVGCTLDALQSTAGRLLSNLPDRRRHLQTIQKHWRREVIEQFGLVGTNVGWL
jgi:polysaccharide pyruvyl transferase WcaK-like protein